MKIKILFGVFAVTISALCGYTIGKKTSKPKIETYGNLRIDNSDPDIKDGLFLELNAPVSYISNKKTVAFKVLKEDYIRK